MAKKFSRIKQEYSAFTAKIKQSGRDGDEEDLYELPDFYKMHELEKDKARHDPPAHISSEETAISDGEGTSLTSSRKRMRMSLSLEAFEKRAEERHAELLGEIKKRK